MGLSIDTGSFSAASPADSRSGVTGKRGASASSKGAGDSADELSEEQREQVEKLKQRDREVRAHEMAHVAAGGQFVSGGASYEYQTGPDGDRYAVGGEVSIDTSPVKGDPKATQRKMQAVQKAALAPAQPSGQDLAVAAKAAQAAAQAQQEAASSDQGGAGGPVGKADGRSLQTPHQPAALYTPAATIKPWSASSAAGGRIDIVA